jgi:hypothetical protein
MATVSIFAQKLRQDLQKIKKLCKIRTFEARLPKSQSNSVKACDFGGEVCEIAASIRKVNLAKKLPAAAFAASVFRMAPWPPSCRDADSECNSTKSARADAKRRVLEIIGEDADIRNTVGTG